MSRTDLTAPATRSAAIAAGRRARSEAAHAALSELRAAFADLFGGLRGGARAH
jgi:hypothetical protein